MRLKTGRRCQPFHHLQRSSTWVAAEVDYGLIGSGICQSWSMTFAPASCLMALSSAGVTGHKAPSRLLSGRGGSSGVNGDSSA